MRLGKATEGGATFKKLHVFTISIKYLINQNIFSLFYFKGNFLLSLLWIQYFSAQEKVRHMMWNFISQGKQSIKPKYFVALVSFLILLGGLLKDSGNGELNYLGISSLRFCQCFFCIKQLGFFSKLQFLQLNYSIM